MAHDALTALFAHHTGRAPELVSSAPGRVNLIGEHTDYNEGFVFPFAIDRRTTAAVGLRDDRDVRVRSTFSDEQVAVGMDYLDTDTPPSIEGWAAYPLGVVWALGRAAGGLGDARGVDIALTSEVPVGAGLSSSAAIECSVGVGLDALWSTGVDRMELARIGRRAENEVVGAPTGIMDQAASMLGAADSAVFLDCRTLETEVVPLGLDAAGLAIVVIDSRVEHEHATGGYRDRREACERGAAALGVSSLRDVTVDDLPRAERELDDVTFRRVRHIVTENQRVLDTVAALKADGPTAIGALLDASHVSMRDDFEISTPELDLAVESSRAAGAIGARMTGGGFGGSVIALTPRDRIDAVRSAVEAAYAERGFTAPHVFVVAAADGARVDSRA